MRKASAIVTILFLLGGFSGANAETYLDFDGDRRSDFVILRYNNEQPNLDWYVYPISTGAWFLQPWGTLTGPYGYDKPVPADYDGDGRTDFAVFRGSNVAGQTAFYILNSSDATLRVDYFGNPGDILNVRGDYDGDGKADPAVYQRLAGGRNRYLYRGSLNNPNNLLTIFYWGLGTQHYPYPGDFDGDGKTDFCTQIGTTPKFTLRRSSDGGTETVDIGGGDFSYYAPPGDYDGDGRTDFCLIRIGHGNVYEWYIRERDGGGTGLFGIRWGKREAIGQYPQGGDFDGDGRSDIGTYSIDTHNFMIRKSSDLTGLTFTWGGGGNLDYPISVY